MTTDNKSSVRATIADLLKADDQDGDRLRQFSTDILIRLARAGVVHLESGATLPLPSDLLEAIQARPTPITTASPTWADCGPYTISTANSVHGSNKGPAGYAAVIANSNGAEKEITCWYSAASTQEAEVRALIMALEQIPKDSTATIISTNRVTVRTFNEWMPKWKRSSWRTASGQEPAAAPLWRWVDVLAEERSITMTCVPKDDASSASRRAVLLAQLALERALAAEAAAQ